jgi:hypothetical protein
MFRPRLSRLSERLGRSSAFRTLTIAALAFGIALPAVASGPGTSGAAFMRVRPMARPVAMGNAYTGLAQGIEALAYNPAGIVTVEKWDVGLSQIIYALDVNYSYAAVARRMNEKTVAAFHLTYMGSDDVSRNATGQITGRFSNYDLAVGLSAGYQMAPEIDLGGTVRVIRSELANYPATAVGLDLGVKYKPLGWPGLSVGATIQNFGTGLEYISSSSPQPLSLRLGVAWQPPYAKYTLSGDVSVDREAQPRANVGAEYHVVENFVLRGGFDVGYDADFTRALKLGMGFLSRIGSFDYAFESLGPTGNTHRISYSYLGGRPKPADGRDTTNGFFASGGNRAPRSTVRVHLPSFTNLSPSPDHDWMSEGLKEIFAQRFQRMPGILLAAPRDSRYRIEGRYSALGQEAVWVGVKIIDAEDGVVVGFKEATIQQSEIIDGATTLAGAVAAAIPGN